MKSRIINEQSFQQSPEFVERLVACFPDVITVLDNNLRYKYVSLRIEEVLGYTPEEYLGTTLGERKDPEDRERIIAFFRDLISSPAKSGTIEYQTKHKDGSFRSFRVNASSLTDEKGKIIGLVASSRDITGAKRVEQQLLQAEKLGAIAEMAAGVAHELNNPLAAILGITSLLRDRLADSAVQRHLGIIEDQARKAADLVQGLLQIARPSRLKNERVSLGEVISRAIDSKRAALENANIAVECCGLDDLPSFEGDTQQMIHVFANLLSNAQEAIFSVRPSGRIRISARQSGSSIEILVDDDGPGIADDIRVKIFDPFFTTRRTGGGTGLGLAICTVILREHHGTIEAQKSPQGGARFRILLPAFRQDFVPSRAAAREGIAGCFILLIEDEDGIREIVEESLRARGVHLESVRSGEEGWERLQSRSYDVCVCDFNLDGMMSGLALFRRASESLSNIPRFIFITGEILDDRVTADLENRGARVLQKPFQIADLVATLERSLAALPSGTK